jgi:hypothetical protein
VIGDEREQHLLANGRTPGPAANALEPQEGSAVEAPHVQGVGDEPRLEETLELRVGAGELRVGAGELIQRLGEDGVRLFVAEKQEELAAEQERRLGSPDGVGDQRVRLPQVLDRSVAPHERLGRTKFQ